MWTLCVFLCVWASLICVCLRNSRAQSKQIDKESCFGGYLSGRWICGSLVSLETIVLINPWLNIFGNLQSCCNTSWWSSAERTSMNQASLSPGQQRSQPQDRLNTRKALCLLDIWSVSPLHERSERPSEEEYQDVGWLVIFKGEVGQRLLWMGSLVLCHNLSTCIRRTHTHACIRSHFFVAGVNQMSYLTFPIFAANSAV